MRVFSWTVIIGIVRISTSTLQWRHNGCDSVSNHQLHDCLFNRLIRCRSKKTSKLRVTGLCEGNSPGTGEFPTQMTSNGENASIWWRHHDICMKMCVFSVNVNIGVIYVSRMVNYRSLQNKSSDPFSNSKYEITYPCPTLSVVLDNKLGRTRRKHRKYAFASPRHLLPGVLQIMPGNLKYDQFH